MPWQYSSGDDKPRRFPLQEGQPCWSRGGHRACPFQRPELLFKGVARRSFTARIERAPLFYLFHRGRARWSPTARVQRGPSKSLYLSLEEWPRLPLLRASDEHSCIVRVLRARRAPGRSFPILPRARAPGAKRADQATHYLHPSPLVPPPNPPQFPPNPPCPVPQYSPF